MAQDSITENPLPEKYKELEKYNRNIEFNFGTIKVVSICTGYISTSNKIPEPVFVWLIKTPSDNYLIDAGLNPNVGDKNYFKGISKRFFEKQFTFYLYKNNYLPDQLKAYNVDEDNLKAVILTHAHFDHIGYLSVFKKVKVILTAKEKKEVWIAGQLAGYEKDTDKKINFERAETIQLENKQSKKINEYLTLIRTDKHTNGHAMILLNSEKEKVLFTGDINFKLLDPQSKIYKAVNAQAEIKSCVLFFNHDQNLK